MRTRTLAALATLLTAGALASCSSTTTHTPTPATPTASATAAAASVNPIEACTRAIQDNKDKGDGAAECTSLPVDDYMEALHRANQRGIDDLQRQIDEASASAAAASNG